MTEILIAAAVLIALIVVASVIRGGFDRVTVFERGLRSDVLLERRGELGAELRERTVETARGLGRRLRSVELNDLMFPGELRRTFAQVALRGRKAWQRSNARAARRPRSATSRTPPA